MRSTLEKKEKSRAVLEIEVDPPRVEQALDRAYRKLVRRVNIPGFRKGRAPRGLLERYLGEAALWDEAVDELVNEAYSQAIEENGLEPVAAPDVDIISMKKGEPFTFRVTVDIRPEVELGDYRELKLEQQPVEVSDEEVEADLQSLRERFAELVAVPDEAAAEKGMFATIDFRGEMDGKPIPNGDAQGYMVELGSGTLLPEIETGIEGMRPGEERSFPVRFPDDYPQTSLAGKEATFTVKLHELKRKQLPEPDDDFARSVEEEAETLEELRAIRKRRLRQLKEAQQRRELERQAVARVVEGARVEVPDSMVEHELGHRLDDLRSQLGRQGLSLEEFLAQSGRTLEQLKDELRPQALEDVKADLVLSEVARREGIEPTDAEIDEEIEAMAAAYGEEAGSVRKVLNQPANRVGVAAALARRQAVDRLVEIGLANVENGDGEAGRESGSEQGQEEVREG
ncbi:MAG: trigger factor [Bacillota bacterium]|nr:trigger factor [Bacillota bacterium]